MSYCSITATGQNPICSLNNNNNSVLIYLHANLTAQGQIQSEHELRDTNKRTQIKPQCDSEDQVSNINSNNNNINNNISSKHEINNNNSLTNSV
jgi:hypothetical protein